MESILFEKQEASLCAQHALNMLLQGSYFTAVDLAEIASLMDARESSVMEEDGSAIRTNSSQNMDDSGCFSVQVLSEALRVFNLELIPLNSPRASEYRQDPTLGRAYICNLNEHWFAVRRFGFQWFNLNSLLLAPQFISETYLSLFFAQLANDGYSIFLVDGELPPCGADEALTRCPVDPTTLARSELNRQSQQEEDPDLARAIALSLSKDGANVTEEDEELKKALESSRRLVEADDHSLQQVIRESMKDAVTSNMTEEEEEMDRQLQRALQMSLQQQNKTADSEVGTSGIQRSTIRSATESKTEPKSPHHDQFDCTTTTTTTTKRSTENTPTVSTQNDTQSTVDNENTTSSSSPQNIVVAEAAEIRKQREQFLKRFEK